MNILTLTLVTLVSYFKWHLEAVEFVVAECSVVVLVGDAKYSAQRSDTQRLQLWKGVFGTKNKAPLSSRAGQTWRVCHHPPSSNLFVFRVIERRGGVKDGLLCIVEELRDVFQVLGGALE